MRFYNRQSRSSDALILTLFGITGGLIFGGLASLLHQPTLTYTEVVIGFLGGVLAYSIYFINKDR